MAQVEQLADRRAKAASLFATTHWSVVQAAGQRSSSDAAAALEQLCQTYWFPVYAYVRRWGHGAEDARDLTQEFFAQLLRDNTVAAADRERGRFRSFLLGILKRFLTHARAHRTAQKRGGGAMPLSWEQDLAEEKYACEPRDGFAPDELFDRRWAAAVLEQALSRLASNDEPSAHPGLSRRLLPFVLGDRDHPPWREVGAEFELSESALKSALRRLRERFAAVVRATIADTLSHPEDVDDELRHLLAVMRR
jgi:RNA polymerase sigma-70 factor (ECF subfamily)